MSPEQVATDPVELRYSLTSEDLADAVVVQQRRVRRSWLAALMAVAVLAGLVKGEVWELSAGAIVVVVVIALAVGSLAVVVVPILLRFVSRWIGRWQVRLIARGNPWLAHPIHAQVTVAGLHLSNAAADSTYAWSHFPVYVETDRSFVLLASERLGAVALVLPKRGVVGAGPERLRALLAAHSRPRV